MHSLFATNATFSVPGFAEPVSSWTHLFAAGVALVAGVLLTMKARRRGLRIAPLVIFTFGAVFLLSMSGVYHLLDQGGAGRAVLHRLDHAAIWVLIAGTFTAIHGMGFRRWLWRWGMPLAIWTVAITGLTLKTIFFTEMPQWVGLVFYLALGWLGVLTAFGLRRRYGRAALRPLIVGGVAYTIGAVIEGVGHPTLIAGVIGPHELFHVAVLAGLTYHFLLVRWLVARAVPTRDTPPHETPRVRSVVPRDSRRPRRLPEPGRAGASGAAWRHAHHGPALQ